MTIRKSEDGEKTLNIIQSVTMYISNIEHSEIITVARLSSATKNKSTYQRYAPM